MKTLDESVFKDVNTFQINQRNKYNANQIYKRIIL